MDKNISIKLPCNIGDTIYTIERNDCPCELCKYGEEMNYSVSKCYESKKEYECPQAVFLIEKHICEGLECFYGCNDKVYFSYEDAESALEEIKRN